MQTASTVNTHARLSYRINGNEIFSQARFQNDIQKVVDRFSLVPFENKKKINTIPKEISDIMLFYGHPADPWDIANGKIRNLVWEELIYPSES